MNEVGEEITIKDKTGTSLAGTNNSSNHISSNSRAGHSMVSMGNNSNMDSNLNNNQGSRMANSNSSMVSNHRSNKLVACLCLNLKKTNNTRKISGLKCQEEQASLK